MYTRGIPEGTTGTFRFICHHYDLSKIKRFYTQTDRDGNEEIHVDYKNGRQRFIVTVGNEEQAKREIEELIKDATTNPTGTDDSEAEARIQEIVSEEMSVATYNQKENRT